MAVHRSLAVAILAGVAAGALTLGAMEAAVRYVHSPWSPTLDIVLVSLAPVVPGVVAGYIAARSGFAVGAIASALTSALWSVYLWSIHSSRTDARSVTEQLMIPPVPNELTYIVAAFIVGGICGVAGAAVAREKRNAF